MGLSVDRRRFVQGLGSATVIGLAGCLSEDDGDGGDDDDTPGSDGLVYAFAPDTIAIVNPEAGEVVDEITDGIDDAEWTDPRITHDHSEIFVVEQSLSQVHVVDTETRTVAETVDVGPGVNHIYHPTDDEIWVHADDEGRFYVIDTESHDVTETVDSGLENEGHGKLLYHEDFGSKAYATNVNDPGLAVIDLETYERTDFIEFGEAGGTHYKAYAPGNGLAYVEYFGNTVIVDVEDDEVVDELEYTGGMFLSPDGDLLAIVDGDDVHLVDVTTADIEPVDTIQVDGNPSVVRYHNGDDGLYAFTANADTADVAVLDLESMTELERLEAGEVDGRSRAGVTGGGYFLTPADADGTVAVVDMDDLEVEHVEVADGVDTVQYVGDSGVGYMGR
ncbi:YncE family protein [Natrialbaceae archaeon A-gly3]